MVYHLWFRKWLGAIEAPSHYLNQWWHGSPDSLGQVELTFLFLTIYDIIGLLQCIWGAPVMQTLKQIPLWLALSWAIIWGKLSLNTNLLGTACPLMMQCQKWASKTTQLGTRYAEIFCWYGDINYDGIWNKCRIISLKQEIKMGLHNDTKN